ncbi:MAG: signal peptide peptidase SppA [Rhizobiaceae bacterium]
MSSTADEIIDRRRLRKKLTFWRVVAILIAAIAIIAASARLFGDRIGGVASDHIAKVRIEGTIFEDDELLDRLAKIAESERVKGVIIAVDSPGGTTAGGEALFEAIREIAETKPVTAQVGTLAASAGYLVASATDHIVARQSSIVGSIGVLVQFPEFTGLMEKIGIGIEEIKSSPLKAEPSPFNETTEAERAMIRGMILDAYDWFVGLVEERRPLNRSEVLVVADGSVFTGRQALEKKLVDSLGGEKAAIKWLESKGVDPELEVLEWKEKNGVNLFENLGSANSLAIWLGLASETDDVIERLGVDRLFLDGLVSVWHPKSLSSE